MLPNLIVIGAERSGTTSLHRYLGAHPQISMSAQKELNFFVAERNWSRGPAWYERQFPIEAPIRGESSPAYTAWPHFAGVPVRMSSLVPHAKLVYLVRDPVERTISALHLAHALGLDRRSPELILGDVATSPYVARSRYASQLERFLEHFPQSAIRVIDSHDLRHQRAATLRSLHRFLGIAEDTAAPALGREFGPVKRRRRNAAGRALWGIGRRTLGDPRTRAIMARTPSWASRLVTAPLDPTVVGPELRHELETVLAPEAAKLRQLTGLALETWSV